MKNNITIGVAILALVLGGFAVSRENVTTTQVIKSEPTVGAITGPLSPYNYSGVGGVVQFKGKTTSLGSATTTVCAIQAPAGASKLVRGGINFSVSTTTATVVTFARAGTAFATTSSLGSATIGASETGAHFATTTSNDVFASEEWFVVGMQGGANNYTSNSGGAAYSPTGACQATWEAI